MSKKINNRSKLSSYFGPFVKVSLDREEDSVIKPTPKRKYKLRNGGKANHPDYKWLAARPEGELLAWINARYPHAKNARQAFFKEFPHIQQSSLSLYLTGKGIRRTFASAIREIVNGELPARPINSVKIAPTRVARNAKAQPDALTPEQELLDLYKRMTDVYYEILKQERSK